MKRESFIEKRKMQISYISKIYKIVQTWGLPVVAADGLPIGLPKVYKWYLAMGFSGLDFYLRPWSCLSIKGARNESTKLKSWTHDVTKLRHRYLVH